MTPTFLRNLRQCLDAKAKQARNKAVFDKSVWAERLDIAQSNDLSNKNVIDK